MLLTQNSYTDLGNKIVTIRNECKMKVGNDNNPNIITRSSNWILSIY